MAVNRFDHPIPGQSLTTTPRNSKWEKPPQFTNKDKALDYLMQQLFQSSMAARMVTLLDAGSSVEEICRIVLFAGFTEGKWNMDLAMLISQPLAAMVTVIYYNLTGKKPKATKDEGMADIGLADSMRSAEAMKPPEPITPEQKTTIQMQLRSSGILGKK